MARGPYCIPPTSLYQLASRHYRVTRSHQTADFSPTPPDSVRPYSRAVSCASQTPHHRRLMKTSNMTYYKQYTRYRPITRHVTNSTQDTGLSHDMLQTVHKIPAYHTTYYKQYTRYRPITRHVTNSTQNTGLSHDMLQTVHKIPAYHTTCYKQYIRYRPITRHVTNST